MNLWWPSVV